MSINIRQDGTLLPAHEIASKLNEQLQEYANVVVTAPPGAGKSTLLPLTILRHLQENDKSNPAGRILMLEPRRLAARQVAERMAWLLGEKVGQTVGYRIRFETKVSEQTRIEVLTEGILTRMLISDPTLEGISVVIFDEFHERSLASDLALTLTREAQSIVRPDLRIVVMSATIDTAMLCSELKAPLIESLGKMYPVEIKHCENLPLHDYDETIRAIASTIVTAHNEHEGDILAFLPGEGEIRRCEELLKGRLGVTRVCPLYGMLPAEQQRLAIAPSTPGSRKVVLATSIAETSLTIEGVRIVVDSGLQRKMVFDSRTSLSHLETMPVSMDMANQRSGRAGRVAEGICYRMWSKATEMRMAEHRKPEILDADLTPMLLDIAAWGESEAEKMQWLTMPPKAHLYQARELLTLLKATDDNGCITKHGQQLARLACHPRIAEMITSAKGRRNRILAADIAALLESQTSALSAKYSDTTDINLLLEELRIARRQNRKGVWERIIKASDYYYQLSKNITSADQHTTHTAGYFIAKAYPERIAAAQNGSAGRYRLANGNNAVINPADEMSAHPWIAIAHMNATAEGRVFLAAPIDTNELGEFIVQHNRFAWDNKQGCIIAEREERIGNLVLKSRPIHDISQQDINDLICDAAKKWGTSMLDFNDKVQALQTRISTATEWHPELNLPDLSTQHVLDTANEWLPMYLGKSTTTAELKKIDLTEALFNILTYDQQQAVQHIVPTHITLPSGRRAKVEYRQGAELPIVRVKIQDCFGMTDTPRVDNNTRPILMELLSPGFKPVQLTQDLRNFWANTYFDVRKELKRRYPKHAWPENPQQA